MNPSDNEHKPSPFEEVSIADRDRYLENGERLFLEKGDVLTQENEERKGVFYLEKGALKLARSILGMNPSTLIYVQEGALLGIDAMIHERPHPYWIIAASEAQVIHYPETDIRSLMDRDPKFQLRLIRDFCTRLKEIEERMDDLLMKTTEQRLADHILHLRELGSSDGVDAFEFHMEEAADHVGSTPDYLHKVLLELTKQGALILRKRRLQVLDPEELRRIADRDG